MWEMNRRETLTAKTGKGEVSLLSPRVWRMAPLHTAKQSSTLED